MAKPTYAQILPSAIIVDDVADIPNTVSSTAPGVFLPWEFFTAAGMNDTDSLSDPESVITAIIKNMYDFYRNDGTENPGIEVDEVRTTVTQRDNQPKYTFQYGLSVFQAFNAPTLDPDTVAGN